MGNYYELTDMTKNFDGHTLYRIRAICDITTTHMTIRAGTTGGWVESESNLQGKAWVADEAKVYGDAVLYDNSLVRNYAKVSGQAQIRDKAIVRDNASVHGSAIVFDNALVGGRAIMAHDAKVFGDAHVAGYTRLGGKMEIGDYAYIEGTVFLDKSFKIGDFANITRQSHVAEFTSNILGRNVSGVAFRVVGDIEGEHFTHMSMHDTARDGLIYYGTAEKLKDMSRKDILDNWDDLVPIGYETSNSKQEKMWKLELREFAQYFIDTVNTK